VGIEHLQGRELLDHRVHRQPRGVAPQLLFQGDLQAAGDEGDAAMGPHAAVHMVVDRSHGQIALQVLERRLHLE